MSAVVAPAAPTQRRLRLGASILGPLKRRLRAARETTGAAPEVSTEDAAYVAALAKSPQAVPRLPWPRDTDLRRILICSLIVHTAIVLLLVWRNSQTPASQEIAVDLVQMPASKVEPKAASKPVSKPVPKPAASQHQMRRRAPPVPHRSPPRPPPVARAPEHTADQRGPNAAQALPGGTDPNGDPVTYSQLVLSQVAKAKKQGRYIGVPGAAAVAFSLGDDGSLVSVTLVRASGDASLDAEAIAMIKRGAPYPPPPPGGRRDYAITLMFSPQP